MKVVDEVTFKEIEEDHIPLFQHIYNYYVVNTTVTFSTEVVSLEEMKDMVIFPNSPFVAYGIWLQETCVGYTVLQPFKTRQAYNHTAEVAIYLKEDQVGFGIGKKTLLFIENIAREHHFHTILSSICSENIASKRLFINHGYISCALLVQVGYKFDRFLDVEMYQKFL